MTGIEPKYREWNGSEDVRAFVISLNLHRRHLTESQRAMVAARVATLTNGQRAPCSIEQGAIPQPQAAKMLNVSVASVRRAKAVRDKGTPKLVKAVEEGKVSVARAARVADLAPGAQGAEAERPNR